MGNVIPDDLLGSQRDREIAIQQVVVDEVVLDHLALVAEAQHELVEAVGRVRLHDVPQNRLTADIDQRLGAIFRLFAEAGAHTTTQDDYLHWGASYRRSQVLP